MPEMPAVVNNKTLLNGVHVKAISYLSLVLAAAALWLAFLHSPASNPGKESAYDRVMRTHTLRCGTFEESPFTILDVNTDARTGIAVALAERIAHDLNLKLEWVPVSNFTTLGEDLRNGRYDAICASAFNMPRAGTIDYTTQYIYVPVYGYTQAGRTADFPDISKIDLKQTKIIGMDGEGATTIARQRLPNATFSILPEVSSIPEMLTALVSHKGDIAFVMPTVFANFDRNNPDKLQKIPGAPFHVFPVSFAIAPNEPALKDSLDIIIQNLKASGELDSVIDNYDPDKLLFRVAKPYEPRANP